VPDLLPLRGHSQLEEQSRTIQALIALARRVNVLWAMLLRDETTFEVMSAAWHFHRDFFRS
jgi:hypothetical protein